MKKIFYILFLCLMHTICLAQSDYDYTGNQENEQHQKLESQDSVQKPSVKHFRKTWKWAHNGVYRIEIPLDTTFDKLHNYNYIFQKNISNTYLANFPSPYESNIFMDREKEEDFYQLTNIRSFLFKPEDALSYNTTTPFTQLKFFTGGGKTKNETLLDIWHVQNIRPFWSAGFRYNLISSDGRYMNQKAKAYNFSVFSSYERERLSLAFFLNQNNGHFSENGGIEDRKYIRDTTVDAENIPVNLSNTSNNYRNFNFYAEVQYNIGYKKEVIQQKDTSYTYPAKAVVTATVEDNEHSFKEQNVNFDFFPNTYIDSVSSVDRQANRQYNLSAKFILNEHPKYKYLPGIYAGLDFKYLDYKQRNDIDTIDRYGNNTYTGTWLTAGIFNVDTNALLTYDVTGRLGLVGYYAGNFRLEGFIQQAFNREKSSYIKASALTETKTVNPYFKRFIGNHNVWENHFSNIKHINIDARYVNTKWRNEVGFALSNTIDYVYFDSLAAPVQSGKNLMVFTAWIKQNFKAGNFYFDQSVYYQKSTDEDILSLPQLAVYSHNYFSSSLFKQALHFSIGIDLFYNTKFYSDSYMPSLMQFYNQRKEKTGGYPKIDVFASFRIKRMDIFAKYEHVNYFFTNGSYFSALDYPINPGMFKFGLRWNFFD